VTDRFVFEIPLIVMYILAALASIHLVVQRREPTATLAWVLSIAFIPYFGVIFYFIFGRRRIRREIKLREAKISHLRPRFQALRLEAAPRSDGSARSVLDGLIMSSKRLGCFAPSRANKVELLFDGEQTFSAIEDAMRDAEHHIHVQYYIFKDDRVGQRLLNTMVTKAKQGVKVRVLCDGYGSIGIEDFMQPLKDAGGQYQTFSPVGRFWWRWHPTLRNHRKIVVVDGKVGFTGGVNIGAYYFDDDGLRDTHLRMEGPATLDLQRVFAEDWLYATDEQPDAAEVGGLDEWFPRASVAGRDVVQVIASGPDNASESIQRFLFSAISTAKQRVYLTTPYFVPDQAMRIALETAAMRGVDVRLLLPKVSDSRLVLHAGRSYYDELLRSGVRIFEYGPGFIHAKVLLVDRQFSTVGSANMDIRSFRLNFEVNAIVYGDEINQQLHQSFIKDLNQSQEVQISLWKERSWQMRAAESVARVLSPVL